MHILFFSSKPYDSASFLAAEVAPGYQLHFQQARLTLDSAILAAGHEVGHRVGIDTHERLPHSIRHR